MFKMRKICFVQQAALEIEGPTEICTYVLTKIVTSHTRALRVAVE
jgi:hypothetical protein